jgi:hypothetical protein
MSIRTRKPVERKLLLEMQASLSVMKFLLEDLQMVADECHAKEENYARYPNSLALPNVIPKAIKKVMINIADHRGTVTAAQTLTLMSMMRLIS